MVTGGYLFGGGKRDGSNGGGGGQGWAGRVKEEVEQKAPRYGETVVCKK